MVVCLKFNLKPLRKKVDLDRGLAFCDTILFNCFVETFFSAEISILKIQVPLNAKLVPLGRGLTFCNEEV